MLKIFFRGTRSVSSPSSSALLVVGALLSAFSLSATAQTPAALPLVTQQIDNGSRVTLHGTVHPLAQKRFDHGAVDDSLATPHIQLMLSRPADREAALKQFITDAHAKGSPSYHKWLTPDQFGKQFGPAESDVAAVTTWLQTKGFVVNKVSRGKSVIDFGGNAGQIKSAFGTSIHKYLVNGETHYANATAITIPSALAPAVKGLVSLNSFKPRPQIKVMGSGTYSPTTHKGTANWNYPFANNSEFFYVAPGDMAVEYDTAPLLNTGTDGTGVTIGIINDSNIDVSLVNGFRTLFGLKANAPQIIIDGNDPGVNSDSIEAYLDVEEAGAVAPGATIDLYIGEDTVFAGGIDLAAIRAVDDDTAQVLNYSFGDCEADLGSENTFYQVEWEQAAAQGQTVMVSSGDSGSESCYPDGYYGLTVSGAASTPYNVAVGGTDFYYSDYQSTSSDGLPPSFNGFWNPDQTSDTPATSITGYIPEQPWNGSTYGLNLATFQQGGASATPVGGGGGQSSCSAQDSSGDCTGGYALPSFQSGFAPSGSTTRSVPDVSLFASNGYNYSTYPICASPGDCNTAGQSATPATVTGVGGTSASSPAFAGIMAMVVQKYGAQGQADYTLYPLSTQFPAAFHDVVAGNNNEPCDPTSQNQLDNSCVQDSGATTFSVQDWPTATGYDLASGLGSVDANVLVADWNKVTFTGTTTALTVNPTSITHGSSVTLTATVTSSSATGDVAFITSAPLPNNKSLGLGTLTAGVATVTSPSTTAADLPGGTYNITAQYEGDGTYAPSASSTQSITVTPEASTLYTNLFDFYQGAVIKSGTNTVPYGTSLVVEAQPIGSGVSQTSGAAVGSLSSDGSATGSVTFTDGSTSSLAIPVNAYGIAEWNPGTFPVGAHSVTGKYTGDASFNASTSTAPITFTVVPGTPLVNVTPIQGNNQSGSSLTVQVTLCNPETTSNGTGCGFGAGLAPTGTVTVTVGSQSTTAALVAYNTGSGYGGVSTVGAGNYSTATVTFTGVPTNATSVSASYSGDGNWNAVSTSGAVPISISGLTPTTTSLTATPSSGNNNVSVINLTSVITGTGSLAPTGSLAIYDNGNSLGSIGLTATANEVSISGDVVTVTVSISGFDSLGGNNQFVAIYSGDTTYAPSSSSASSSTVTVDQSDFNMVTSTPVVSITAGSSGTGTVNLYSIAGFDAGVSLTCAGNSGLTCSVNPTSLTLNGSSTLSVTINAPASASLNKPQIAPTSKPLDNSNKSFWFAGGSIALAALTFFGIPARRRGWRSMLGLLLFAVLTANFGCGGSSGGGGGGTTPAATPTFSPAAGTYASTQSVTISDSTSGASIYYTTDGSTPTTSSTKYSAAISVSKTETLNAIATASGFSTSAEGSAAYSITASGGTGRTFGSPTPADTVVVTATSSGANPVVHSVAIQVAIHETQTTIE